jgi:hypothetical protein
MVRNVGAKTLLANFHRPVHREKSQAAADVFRAVFTGNRKAIQQIGPADFKNAHSVPEAPTQEAADHPATSLAY